MPERALPEEVLPPAILDPLLRFKIDCWHSAHNATLRRLRMEGAGISRPLRVMFLVPDTSLWDVYASIYADMAADPQFEPSVLAFQRRGVSVDLDAGATRAFFEARGITPQLTGFDPGIEPTTPATGDADVLFYTLGSIAYPPALQIEFTSLSFLTCYLPYGFLLAHEYQYQFNQEFHHSAWRVFAATERELALYRHFSHRRESNLALTGYPKFDVLYECPADPASRPTVIWAPHWTIGTIYPQLNLGTFHEICMGMFEIFDAFPECDFVYKPHPTLAYALEQTTFMMPESYAIYLDMLRARPNVRIWMHGDYADIFARSAAMITDSVSFLAEYLMADRPLLFMNREDRARLSQTGEDVISLHYSGRTLDDIRAFITDKVIGSHDEKGVERRSRRAAILGLSTGRASRNILNDLAQQIGFNR